METKVNDELLNEIINTLDELVQDNESVFTDNELIRKDNVTAKLKQIRIKRLS